MTHWASPSVQEVVSVKAMFGIFIQVGVLWFLITLYSRSSSSSTALRETWIVVIGMLAVSLLCRFFLSNLLGPFVGLPSLIALYFLVDKVCGLSRAVTIKICVIYVAVMIFIGLVFGLLTMPVTTG